MILALNLNPSLDKIYTVDKLEYGGVVRAKTVDNTAGGKGIHVANVCKALDEDCIVSGFLGGRTGQFITDKLDEKQMKHDFVQIQKETRACINIATPDGNQTEVLEPGPEISEKEQHVFLQKYEQLAKQAEIIIASGSLPGNMPHNFYGILAEIAHKYSRKFLVDTSGRTLQETLACKPFLIKPNKDEIEALSDRKINSVEEAAAEVSIFQQMGIALPIVSLGKNGSVIGYEGKIYHAIPPKYKAINAVGSGDAFVAGIAIGLKRNYSIIDTIKLGSACGTANVLEAESGYVSRENVDKIFKLVKVTQIK